MLLRTIWTRCRYFDENANMDVKCAQNTLDVRHCGRGTLLQRKSSSFLGISTHASAARALKNTLAALFYLFWCIITSARTIQLLARCYCHCQVHIEPTGWILGPGGLKGD